MLNYRTIPAYRELWGQFEAARNDRGVLVLPDDLGLPVLRERGKRLELDPQAPIATISIDGAHLTNFFSPGAIKELRENCPNTAFVLHALCLAVTSKRVHDFKRQITKGTIQAALQYLREEELTPKINEVLGEWSLPEGWELTVSEDNKVKLHAHGVLLKSDDPTTGYTVNPLLTYTKSSSSSSAEEGTGFGGDGDGESAADTPPEPKTIEVTVVRVEGQAALYVQKVLRDSGAVVHVEEKDGDPGWFQGEGAFPFLLEDVQLKPGNEPVAA